MNKGRNTKKEFISNEEREQYYIEKRNVKDFIKNSNKFLMTSRFNNLTWNENENYRKKNNMKGCIYCSPDQITLKIPVDSIVFILEMNNEKNEIIGIGMAKNHPTVGKYLVYTNGNYNRYVYSGKYRIDRKNMNTKEEEIMKAFDILCFKGNTHMKRGNGLKMFPSEMLYRCLKVINLVEFITEMFKSRFIKNKETDK
jgi:hypothetical protein